MHRYADYEAVEVEEIWEMKSIRILNFVGDVLFASNSLTYVANQIWSSSTFIQNEISIARREMISQTQSPSNPASANEMEKIVKEKFKGVDHQLKISKDTVVSAVRYQYLWMLGAALGTGLVCLHERKDWWDLQRFSHDWGTPRMLSVGTYCIQLKTTTYE